MISKSHFAAPLAVMACLAFSVGNVQAQTQTVTYRMYLFDPDPSRTQQALQAVEQTLSSLGRLEKTVGLLPTPLPATPGAPSFKTVQMGPFSQRVLDCDNAYARLHRFVDSSNPLGFTTESYTGCVYPTLGGTRIAVVFNRSTGGRGFLGDLVKGIAKTVEGDDAERARKNTSEMLASLRKALPELLVDLVELPGSAPERPDGAAVDQRLAAVAPKPQAPALPMPAATTPAATGMAAAIEARKQLTSMGLAYYGVDAFHEAIRRVDAIAVQLFVDAGAVASNAKGKDGLTAVEVAAATGDQSLIDIIRRASR